MITPQEIMYLTKQTDKLLDIIYNVNDFTTSDLQGLLEAIIMDVYNKGKEANNK